MAVALTLAGCQCDQPDRSGVQNVSIDTRTTDYWLAQGYSEMVPPLRPPSSANETLEITVWIKLPPAGTIETVPTAHGHTLRYPVGTIADRVETRMPHDSSVAQVVDVRGTTFLPDGGEAFHVLRNMRGTLKGFRWLRGDPNAQQHATAQLNEMLGASRGAQRLAKLNDCAGCHEHLREQRTTLAHITTPNRAADASGLYQVQTVLHDEVPVEYSRPREMNLDDRYITFRCLDPSQQPSITREDSGARAINCPNRGVVIGKLDVAAARAAGDERVARLCRSRLFLYEHLDDLGKKTFARAAEQCR